MIRLAIFASGSGTNAQKLMEFFEDDHEVSVGAVFCNKPEAQVIERSKKFGIPVELFEKRDLMNPHFCKRLDFHFIDVIVLAGFLLKIPPHIIRAFPDRIINIHPSLLPKYGGKGMYGNKVHEAVLANNESESGITIHLVNEIYDDGRILCQKTCQVLPGDTSADLAARIHKLEHEYFPMIVNEYVRTLS